MRYTDEEIKAAKSVDMVELLQRLGHPLKRLSAHDYCMVEHDSFVVSRGKGWYWNSRAIGGNAIDFFRCYPDYMLEFRDAVKRINEVMQLQAQEETMAYLNIKTESKEQTAEKNETPFVLPVAFYNNDRVKQYLTGNLQWQRSIDPALVSWLIEKKKLYESDETHNAVFVGYDYRGNPKSAFKRGTMETRFAGLVSGSDKRYPFRIERRSENLFVYEAAIDLLSDISVAGDIEGNYLDLTGVSLKAISTFLAESRFREIIKNIYVRTDNDFAGHDAARRICEEYADRYNVYYYPPKNKDCNMDLKERRAQARENENHDGTAG